MIEFGFSEWWFIARDLLSNRVGKVNWLLRWKLEGWIEESTGHWVTDVDSLSVVWFMLVDFILLCIPTNFKRISSALVRSTFGNSNTLVFHSVIVRIINVEALTYETETRIYSILRLINYRPVKWNRWTTNFMKVLMLELPMSKHVKI